MTPPATAAADAHAPAAAPVLTLALASTAPLRVTGTVQPAKAVTVNVYKLVRGRRKLVSSRRLKAAGILPHWPINHGVTTSMYYRDPDNNRVELQIDNFATPAELDGYFHSPAFAENPVGVTYDPEELCRRYEAGEAMADLLRIPPLPEGKTPWDMLARH